MGQNKLLVGEPPHWTISMANAVGDLVHLPLLIIDRGFKVKYANESFYQKFKIDIEGINLSLRRIISTPHTSTQTLETRLLEIFGTGKDINSVEWEYRFPNLGKRKTILTVKEISWEKSFEQALIITIEDITERKQIEDEMAHLLMREQEARSQAEKGNFAKDLFLATLSHEIRTPLTTILLWTQMLRLGKVEGEKAAYAIQVIENSAQTQEQIISDLLDVSRIIMGKLSLRMREIDPIQVVKDALESVRIAAEDKSVQIHAVLDKTLGRVAADPVRLQQVIWNLLSNSIKFSEVGGRIDIRIDSVEERAQGNSWNYIRIRITDKGIGIKQDFLPKIFDRFSQADRTSTRAHGGLGLGLAIVKSIMDAHGGTVSAESPGEGKGSTFTVRLPIVPNTKVGTDEDIQSVGDRVEKAKIIIADSNPLKSYKILIVDDEPRAREAFKYMLETYGAEVVAVSSAKEALGLVVSRCFDLIISDLGMPDEDGYALIKKIRALPAEKGGTIPAIALTAFVGPEDVKKVVESGFQRHVGKPVEAVKLIPILIQTIKDQKALTIS